MAEIKGTRKPLLKALKQFDRDATAMFTEVADRARGVLLRNAGPDGKIPLRREDEVKQAIGDIVQRMFTAPDGRKVFDEQGRGLSPYAQALNQGLVDVTWGVLQAHHKYLKDTLPDDLYVVLRTTRVAEQGPEDDPIGPLTPLTPPERGTSSISAERRAQLEEQKRLRQLYEDLRLFSPNPFAQYEWAHTWVDPNGYRLSDRVWQAAIRTRVKVDTILADGIRQGMSAESIAKQLERFLRPDRADLRTDKPYGRDASYDAMRLARSEITRAHSQAALTSALRNPYVSHMNWRLSGSHPKPDICDDRAKGSPYPIAKKVPLPVQDSHPQCLCVVTPGVDKSPAQVSEEMRAALEEARVANLPPNITPVQAENMLIEMVGRELAKLVLQGVIGV